MAVLVHNVRQETIPNFFGRTIDRETNTDWVDFWWEADNGATN